MKADAHPHPNPEPTRVNSNRLFFASVILITVLTAEFHVMAARSSLSWMWGVHFYAFFPRWLLIVATMLLGALVLAVVLRSEQVAGATVNVLARSLAGRRLPIVASILVLAGTIIFWTARISHTYLGDGNVIVERIDTFQELLEREPLSSLLQYAVYRTTKPWFATPNRPIEWIARDALAPGSVLAGFVFLILAWGLASEIARLLRTESEDQLRTTTMLAWLVVVSQGYVQLFFGYVENYSFNAVGVVAYFWLALRALRGASPLFYPGLALVLCCALHMSSLVLGASFVALGAPALLKRERRARALRDLAITAGVAIALGFVFSRVSETYNPFATLLAMARTAFSHEGNPGYMFSSSHYRDFFNEQMLIGPLGMFLFLPAAIMALGLKEIRRRAAVWFFLVAGLGYLVTCWMIGDSNLGYARDWDLLSQSGIVFTVSALVLFLLPRVRHAAVVASLVCAIGVSVYHTAPWIATNADEGRSLARLKTLPLGLGRTEVVLSTWYRQRADSESQRYWLQQAIRKNPHNVSALSLLGALDYKSGRYEEAAASLTTAIQLRPDKLVFRALIVQSLISLNRFPEAIPHLEVLVRADPQDASVQITMGEALDRAGRRTEAREAFVRAESLYRPMVEQHPNDAVRNVTYGYVLCRSGRPDEGIRYLEKAVALDPQSKEAHCYLGYVLRQRGRNAEAGEHFRTCLTLNPGFPGRLEIENWLARAAPPTQQ